MRFIYLFLLFTFCLEASAQDFGMCKPLPSSKKYTHYSSQKTYPRDVSFTCEYKCQSKEGSKKILGTTHLKLRNAEDDAKRSVCQGVLVKKVSWGWEYDSETEFYAHMARSKELKAWANKNIFHFNKQDKKLLAQKKLDINKVARSYLEVNTPGHKYFKEAGIILMDIAYHIPENTKLLEEQIDLMRKSPAQNMDSKLGLIQNVLKTHLSFLLP